MDSESIRAYNNFRDEYRIYKKLAIKGFSEKGELQFDGCFLLVGFISSYTDGELEGFKEIALLLEDDELYKICRYDSHKRNHLYECNLIKK